jgi:hypothetical protein
MIEGTDETMAFDNPFLRWHKSFENYSGHLYDIDDHTLHGSDEFERLKKYTPDDKHVAGMTPIIPRQDNDEALEFYDIQGEGPFTNPPNPNTPVVDHGQDENHIWAFGKTLYNQTVVKNNHMPGGDSHLDEVAPWWGEKLTMPHFYKREKMVKFYRQWNHRRGLELIKMRHAKKYGLYPTQAQLDEMSAEISAYIDECYQYEREAKLEDVYVTDHTPVEKKYVTNGEADDEDFYNYARAVEEYNSDLSGAFSLPTTSRYERGSLLQRALDPFAGAKRDSEGSLLYRVEDKELGHFDLNNEEAMRAEYALLKSKDEVWELDDEDADAVRLGLLDELESGASPFDKSSFENILNKELSVFQDTKYDYVRDLKDAYRNSLKTTREEKIFATIPDHVFWDIKTPQ